MSRATRKPKTLKTSKQNWEWGGEAVHSRKKKKRQGGKEKGFLNFLLKIRQNAPAVWYVTRLGGSLYLTPLQLW